MKHLPINLLVMGCALSLAAAPLALAQDHPNDATHPAKTAPAHPAPKKPVVHHKPVVVKRTAVNEHVTEHVNEHVTQRVAPVAAARGPVVAAGGQRWHSGDRFVGSRVVFVDYARYNLRQPPFGYEWVQDGDELVMISLATGLIGDTFVIVVP